MRHSIPIVLALTVVWMALWESATAGTILAGLAVGAAVLWVIPSNRTGANFRIRPIKTLGLVLYFSRMLVMATALVAWEVATPQNRINQGIVKVPMQAGSNGVVTIVANMISLTPGTLTIEVLDDPMTLYVHVLHLRSLEEVRSEVRKLEGLVIEAFGVGPSPDTENLAI